MQEQLIKVYEAEIEALRRELAFTRQFIYRDYELKEISNNACQDLINEFIKQHKIWFTQGNN